MRRTFVEIEYWGGLDVWFFIFSALQKKEAELIGRKSTQRFLSTKLISENKFGMPVKNFRS